MIRWAFGRGLRTYEFLGADEAFKLDWTASLRERIALHAFPRSPAGAVAWTAQSYGRPLAKRARDVLRRAAWSRSSFTPPPPPLPPCTCRRRGAPDPPPAPPAPSSPAGG